MTTKRRTTKRRTRRRPPARTVDEKTTLVAVVRRLLAGLARKRIDEVQELYDAANAEARRAIEAALARAKTTREAKAIRGRQRAAVRDLQARFVDDANAAVAPVRALQVTLLEAIDAAERDAQDAAAQAAIRIASAVAESSWEASSLRIARQARLSAWLRGRGLVAPRPRREARAAYHQALEAVSAMRDEEKALRDVAAADRASTEEWAQKAGLARAAGREDLVGWAEERCRHYEAAAGEQEREVARLEAARQGLEARLEELARRLSEPVRR
jgi:hypothetical protein